MEARQGLGEGEGWGLSRDEWARLQRLLELARSAHRAELTPERREQIRARVLERWERRVARRRLARRLLAGASAALLCGSLLLFFRARRASAG